MITNEICIDLIEFIVPSQINPENFRELWRKYDWENKIIITTSIKFSFKLKRSYIVY